MRRTRNPSAWSAPFLLLLTALSGCQLPGSQPRTAKDFVRMYSDAYEREDVNAIVKLTIPLKDQSDDSLKAVIQDDIRKKSFSYVAWTHTRYESEADHGKYIQVEVRVDEAVSTIVLVPTETGLKVSQEPSSFQP